MGARFTKIMASKSVNAKKLCGRPKANIDHFITQLNTRGQVHKSEKVYDRKKEKNKLKKDLTLYK